MFRLRQPSAEEIDAQIAAADGEALSEPTFLRIDGREEPTPLPSFFVRDISESCLGRGGDVFAAAKRAFKQWAMFDLGWVRIANQPTFERGQIVAVQAHTLGLWTLNLSRIVVTIDTPARFGFVYATMTNHVEEGEERFLLEFDQDSGGVVYKLEAVSRPRHALARIGIPIARAFQHRFAHESHQRMREAVSAIMRPCNGTH